MSRIKAQTSVSISQLVSSYKAQKTELDKAVFMAKVPQNDMVKFLEALKDSKNFSVYESKKGNKFLNFKFGTVQTMLTKEGVEYIANNKDAILSKIKELGCI